MSKCGVAKLRNEGEKKFFDRRENRLTTKFDMIEWDQGKRDTRLPHIAAGSLRASRFGSSRRNCRWEFWASRIVPFAAWSTSLIFVREIFLFCTSITSFEACFQN